MEGSQTYIFRITMDIYKVQIIRGSVIYQYGVFSVKEDEVRLYRIMDVSLERKLWQRMCGLGTIKCCSAVRSAHLHQEALHTGFKFT